MSKKKNSEYFDLRFIVKKILSKWHWFLFSLFICLSIGVALIKLSPKVYKVSSSIKMKTGNTNTSRILSDDLISNNILNIEDQMVEITSSEYVKSVLEKLDFGISFYEKTFLADREVYKDNFPFSIEIDSSQNQMTGTPIIIKIISGDEYELSVKGNEIDLYNFNDGTLLEKIIPNFEIKEINKFGNPVKYENLSFTISLMGDAEVLKGKEFYFILHNPQSLSKKYMSKIEVELVSLNSNILTLSTEGNVVKKEIIFLDTLMDVVRKIDLNEKNSESLKTIDFIDFQLRGASESLSKVESDLESFQSTTTIFGETSALYEKRDELETELNNLNIKLNYYKNILGNLESSEGLSSFSTSTSNDIAEPLLTNLLITLSELTQQRVQVGRTATEANPIVQRLNLEITTTKNSLKEYLLGAISTTNIMKDDLRARINANNRLINRLPSNERKKLGIERQFEFTDNTYDIFLQKKADAGLVLATNSSNWKVIEYAKMEGNGPVSPNKIIILFIFLFLGSSIPLLLIIVTDFFNTTIASKEDLRKISDIPLIGTISKGNKGNKFANEYNPKSPFMESLRGVRFNIQYMFRGNSQNVIGFTSSSSGEGKTFSAINLGINIAQSRKKVIVLDTDLRKSNLNQYYKSKNNVGLSTYLIGKSELEDIIINTGINNFNVIVSGPFPPNPDELLSLPKMEKLINDLKSKYDYVLIDSPPLGIVSDYLELLKFTNSTIYIVRQNYTQKDSIEKVNELTNISNNNNIYFILNGVEMNGMYGNIHSKGKNKNYYG